MTPLPGHASVVFFDDTPLVLQKHPTHPAFPSQGWLTPYALETNDSNSEEYNGQSLNKQRPLPRPFWLSALLWVTALGMLRVYT